MIEILFIIAKTISIILDVVSLGMLVRMIIPWFTDPMNSRLYTLSAFITEPFVAPIRGLLVQLNIGQDSPIDWAFSIAYIIIWLLRNLLPAI